MRSFLLCGVSQSFDVRKTAPPIGRNFCVCTPMRIFWSSADMRRFLLYEVCVDVRKIAPRSFCLCTQIKKLLEFLRVCADYFSVEFLRLYAKSSAPLLGICVSTQINNVWSFCGYAQLLEPEKVTFAPTIRRPSNIGVSASVRKKAPRLY